MLDLRWTPVPSDAYRALIWESFFASRGRGVSLQAHFPWLGEPASGTASLELYRGAELLAGLVLKDCSACAPGGGRRIAAIALVTVALPHRGHGHSRRLLRAALDRAVDQDLDALTLWTNTPQVYQPFGFQTQDSSLFGWVDQPGQGAPAPGPVPVALPPGLPLPPFARALRQVEGSGAACILLEDDVGLLLADYQGAPAAAARLLAQAMPNRWRLNSRLGDPLPAALAAGGARLALRPTHLQMWRPLKAGLGAEDLARSTRFTVLDRL